MKRIPVVDVVRGLSILAVLAVHLACIYITIPSHSIFLRYLWYKLWIMGGYGVIMFFVVSGFLITRIIAETPSSSLFQPHLRDFYSRRIGRILPLLVLTSLLGVLTTHLISNHSPGLREEFCLVSPKFHLGPAFWATLATFSNNWYKTWLACLAPYYNGPFLGLHWDILWSLSIEEQFYIFYPLLLKRIRTPGNMTVFCLFLILLGLSLNALSAFYLGKYRDWNSFRYFGLMGMGGMLYLASEKLKFLLSADRRIAWVVCVAGFLLMCKVYFHSPARIYVWNGVWGSYLLGLAVFFFVLGGMHLPLFHSKFWLPLTFPGKLSYGLYLYQALTLYFLWPILEKKNEYVAFVIYAGVSSAVAYISYRYYEMPMNFWIRRKLNPQGGGFSGGTVEKSS